MKKLISTFGLLMLLTIVTSFTTPSEIGGHSQRPTLEIGGHSQRPTFEIGGHSQRPTFEIGGHSQRPI